MIKDGRFSNQGESQEAYSAFFAGSSPPSGTSAPASPVDDPASAEAPAAGASPAGISVAAGFSGAFEAGLPQPTVQAEILTVTSTTQSRLNFVKDIVCPFRIVVVKR